MGGSVLEARAEAIVNAANTELAHGGGVAAAIARAAGPELTAESRRVAPCPLGGAVATTAGRLRAGGVRWVIHVPTVDFGAGRSATAAELTAGTGAALALARSLGCGSIAFPLLGAGIAGQEAGAALRAMVAGFGGYEDLDIMVCAYSARHRAAVAAVLGPTP